MSRERSQHDGRSRLQSPEIGHRTVTDASVQRFGELTGDYARMHFDQTYGPAHGMGGTIAHGLLSGAWALGALAQHAPDRLGLREPDAWIGGFRVKFGRMVYLGDRFSLRWREPDEAERPCIEGLEPFERRETLFETLSQRGEVTGHGAVSVCLGVARDARRLIEPPEPLEIGSWSREDVPVPIYAEDMVEHGPRGVSLGRTVTESDLVEWARFSGELNPTYLNEMLAREGRFGARIAPPMWTFCLAFGDYLRDLLSVSMPSSGFAGHLGDSWRFLEPVFVGDTIRTRHRPVACRPSRSHPDKAVVEFALQVENQRDEIVQEGRVVMMIPARGDA